MHVMSVRRLAGALVGAVACAAVFLSPVRAQDGSPSGRSAAGPVLSTPGNAGGPILRVANEEKADKEDQDSTPTLAPPRKNTIRLATKLDGKQPDGKQPDGKQPESKQSGSSVLLKPPAGDDDGAPMPRYAPRGSKESGGPRLDAPADNDAPMPSAPSRNRGAVATEDKAPLPTDRKTDGPSLKPIPDAPQGPAELDAASFNGVTPGVSTLAEMQKTWGQPREVKNQGEVTAHLYKVEPFENVEVLFFKDKVISIIIRLNKAFPADAVAQQLALTDVRPVLVLNEMGEILGQAFPERGVLFSFEPSGTPGKPSMKVAQIILESITAEPFLLRAESNLETQYEASLRDLDQALKFSGDNARAHWLRARVLMSMGDPEKAVKSADAAVRLESKDPQFRVTRAQILGQLGRFDEAIADAEKAVAASGERPHIKARAQCLMGDLLGSGPQPDYKRAIDYHYQAIKTADAASSSPHPAVRLPAKEVLVDAHLGAAHDIAWGNWNQKQSAVSTWLKRASAFADDVIQNDGGSKELRFRVATRALAACVGGQGKIDPGEWTDQAIQIGQDLIKAAGDTPQKQQIQWELGMALYDTVQIYQMRSENPQALKYGEKAIEYLENARVNKDVPVDAYLVGRLYFRVGSIHAIGQKNHRSAITWFNKAVPVLQQAAPQVAPFELGRLGETFVSMGVSYWETGQRDKAVKLTQQGVELMEKAVQAGQFSKTALDVPYANLATMHRQLGQDDQAEKYLERSSARKPGTTRR